MKHKTLYIVTTGLLLLSMVLTGCQTQAAATPTPTLAPKPTEVPTPAFQPLKLEAADCSYGGELKSIEAVDALTVKFTLCAPDPCFPRQSGLRLQ